MKKHKIKTKTFLEHLLSIRRGPVSNRKITGDVFRDKTKYSRKGRKDNMNWD